MKTIITLSLCCLLTQHVFSQTAISINNINQGFSLGNNSEAPLPINWRLAKSNSVRTVNPYPSSTLSKADISTQFKGGNLMSANSPAGFYNLGVGDSLSASNRAIGFLADNVNTKTCNLYFHLKNTGPTAITSLFVEYFARKFRNGSNLAGFQIQMYHSIDGINWINSGPDLLIGTSPDANNNGFTIIPASGLLIPSGSIEVNILPNAEFYLAWSYSVSTGLNTDNAPVYGIDGVAISPSVALPISLVKFTADKFSEKVKVQWTTATELNNDKFIVERSANGENFEFVSEKNGAGNSKELNSYEIIDASPLKGTSYYRLTQYDFNGASETFAPVAVNMGKGTMSMEYIAGSGEQGVGSIDLKVFSPTSAMATIAIRDLSGRTIYSEEIMLQEGYQNFNIATANFGAGIYLISLNSDTDVLMKKVKL
jgi:hypothetical protein